MSSNTYRFSLGDFDCVAIRDLSSARSLRDLVINASDAELAQAAAELGLPLEGAPSDYSCLLIRTGGQNVLVDAGVGDRMGDVQGWLLQGLRSLGIEPGDIDRIAITHADGDHIGGILDTEGRRVFANARYAMWQGAWDYWAGSESLAAWPEERLAFIRGTLDRIADRVDLYGAEEEFLPGLQILPAVGHKYDHTVLKLSSRGEQLLHLADAVVHPLFLARPDWYSMYDVDAKRALQVKRRLLDWAAAEGMLLFATHFPFPAVGHVRSLGLGWEWVPVETVGA